MKQILITGGAGFIGYHLGVKLSENKDNHVTVADNLQRGRFDKDFEELIAKENVTFENVDLCDVNSMQSISKYFDEVYHLAAFVGVKHCMKSTEKVLYTNIQSTINMIDLVKKNRCKKLVFSSTCENYASGFSLGVVKVPTDETVPLSIADVKNPRLSYAGSKIVGEQMVIFNAPGNYNYSIVRYHNVFGQRMGYAHVVPEVVNRIFKKENPFKVFGSDQTRAFCHVSDAVEQTIATMESDKIVDEIIHIGNSSEEIRISDLVKKIFSILDYKPELNEADAPEGSVNRRCPNTKKIESLSGLKPKKTLEEGLRLTVDWYWKEIQAGNVWE
ncbi:MAG: NAD-dependent epimerase/dehydratase family protein [Bdellovibrionales bacterium]|nr:NAD-dependent epimerase/dehydratase family protein [Bdellovibrionales bacterium]